MEIDKSKGIWNINLDRYPLPKNGLIIKGDELDDLAYYFYIEDFYNHHNETATWQSQKLFSMYYSKEVDNIYYDKAKHIILYKSRREKIEKILNHENRQE